MSRVFGHVQSKKGFYIGDICYVLPDRIYQDFFGGVCQWKVGVHQVPDSKFSFAVNHTFYGDGTYVDNDGNEYGVDAGIIGVVPLELTEMSVDECKECGRVIERAGVIYFDSEDGVFKMSMRGMDDIVINTVCGTVLDGDGDDDDDYDYVYGDDDYDYVYGDDDDELLW